MRWQRYWKNIQSRWSCAGPYEYRVGTPEEVEESIVRQIQLFHLSESDQIEQSELYKRVKASSRRIDSVDELEKQGIIIHKIFPFYRRSGDA